MKGCEFLLSVTVDAGLDSGTAKEQGLSEVVIDTTVMEKTIAHRTDSRLNFRACKRLAKRAKRVSPRNYLKGSLGDAINAVLASASQNLRMILRPRGSGPLSRWIPSTP